MEKLIVLGTGNAMVTKCYNTCFALQRGSEYVLVDAGGGNGILAQLTKAGVPYTAIRHLIVTHAHCDHLLGVVWMVRKIGDLMMAGKYQGQLHVWCHASIIEAMEKGNLYASTGATIHALTIDKGIVSVDCSPAHCIKITSHCRRGGGHFLPAEGQDTLTHCELDLNNWLDTWKKDGQDNAFIRVEVTAPNGAKAYTRAYRLAELL